MLIAHDSSVDIGNHRYTNEQNCILLKKSMIRKNFAPPIQKSSRRPCSVFINHVWVLFKSIDGGQITIE